MELIEMTIPDKPRSKNQKYRLTAKGQAVVKDEGGSDE
jgi:ATP-dependent DNA helicase RecG